MVINKYFTIYQCDYCGALSCLPEFIFSASNTKPQPPPLMHNSLHVCDGALIVEDRIVDLHTKTGWKWLYGRLSWRTHDWFLLWYSVYEKCIGVFGCHPKTPIQCFIAVPSIICVKAFTNIRNVNDPTKWNYFWAAGTYVTITFSTNFTGLATFQTIWGPSECLAMPMGVNLRERKVRSVTAVTRGENVSKRQAFHTNHG